MDRLIFIVAVLVGQQAGAVDEKIGGGGPLRVVVVVAALSIRLPDVEHSVRQGAARIEAIDAAADDQHRPRL